MRLYMWIYACVECMCARVYCGNGFHLNGLRRECKALRRAYIIYQQEIMPLFVRKSQLFKGVQCLEGLHCASVSPAVANEVGHLIVFISHLARNMLTSPPRGGFYFLCPY